MLPSSHWARNFTVNDEDVDHLVNHLLETETPLPTRALATILVERRLEQEVAEVENRYQDTSVYDPSESYDIGQKLVFPALEFATATVQSIRDGLNPDYGDFKVLTVSFEDGFYKNNQFAAEYQQPHKLIEEAQEGLGGLVGHDLTLEELLEEAGDLLDRTVDEALTDNDSLVQLANQWFPVDLMIEADEGHLNLAEAVLDMYGGGPMTTVEILENIGGISDSSPMSLQEFSLNYFMNQDSRFDEVGATGEVLWYLARMEPEGVRQLPPFLQYTAVDIERGFLSDEMLALESEIGDELSPMPEMLEVTEGAITLIYPHRRVGTLPLSARVRAIFPTAQRTDRIFITLVDAADGEEYIGWVVPEYQYIYGLLPIYNKHALPVGASITVKQTDDPGRIVVDCHVHRVRSEWVRLVQPKGDQFGFENTKRGIGAEYDDLVILGIEDLEGIDSIVSSWKKRPLVTILKMLIPGLGRLTPQGAAHFKTIYSVANVIRRCPPALVMVTLEANPEFQDLGGGYWRLEEG